MFLLPDRINKYLIAVFERLLFIARFILPTFNYLDDLSKMREKAVKVMNPKKVYMLKRYCLNFLKRGKVAIRFSVNYILL